ncbi:phosphatidylglycerophosphatase A family protein [Thalassotalea agarivorans]|uniref:Phosphatidylglycerophosphatase A n=1 Tax=Thalassotalea agarivorans TaxID=349064 RepID=A0A1H9YHV0_THASX|nr:phosphatidylglycerophosphatase A [Thalassotalea agarivorans]SES68501.1 phosphatidylglycerophosphatase [Thalassotalea agarivorans]
MNKSTKVNFKLSDPVHFLALGFGSGLAPKAPGTFGTLAAIPLVLLMAYLPALEYAAVMSVAIVFGVYLCGKTARDVGVHDHGAIVWDEIAGLMVTMFMMPITWQSVALGFVLFRIFDILKPWPISLLDKKVHGGLGIMLDDILAGAMAWLIMYFVFLH